MNRPWKVWLAFATCAAVVLAALAWISLTALRLERVELNAQEQADLEERVRLALWRMDSALSPLVVEENARPATDYQAFAPTERAFTKAGGNYTQAKQGEVVVSSPLLAFASSNVLLHFQLSPDGRLNSPQVPLGEQRLLAQTNYVTPAQITAATARLEELRRLMSDRAPVELLSAGQRPQRKETSSDVPTAFTSNGQLLLLEAGQGGPAPEVVQQQFAAFGQQGQPAEKVQQLRSTAEFASRANFYNRAQQQAVEGNLQLNSMAQVAMPQSDEASSGLSTFKAFWLGNSLVLARRAQLGGSFVIQGVWLNWEHLRATLLASVKDLLPDASLVPVLQPTGDRQGRMLAVLPVRLVPGPVSSERMLAWTPVRLSLAVAWICVLLAALAVALLLHGTLSLSERRAAFVSAVTHELRTPLTTFRMYSEMLADDMVPDPARRRSYLQTLCSEAGRLSHLVENVLAYARLERGSARSRVERVPLGELISRVKPRLLQRTEQAGMSLVSDADPATLATVVYVDVSAVEQVLFNLVDNACKYAAPTATEKVIHLEALPESGKFAMLRVRDHGQGISEAGAKRLFQPFSKSADEAAHTAPGVGLGLALCRRLSRSMGGDLHLDTRVKNGAGFVLSLPLSTGT